MKKKNVNQVFSTALAKFRDKSYRDEKAPWIEFKKEDGMYFYRKNPEYKEE